MFFEMFRPMTTVGLSRLMTAVRALERHFYTVLISRPY